MVIQKDAVAKRSRNTLRKREEGRGAGYYVMGSKFIVAKMVFHLS